MPWQSMGRGDSTYVTGIVATMLNHGCGMRVEQLLGKIGLSGRKLRVQHPLRDTWAGKWGAFLWKGGWKAAEAEAAVKRGARHRGSARNKEEEKKPCALAEINAIQANTDDSMRWMSNKMSAGWKRWSKLLQGMTTIDLGISRQCQVRFTVNVRVSN